MNQKPPAHSARSSRAFNHDVSHAKKAAKSGPVFITDQGRPSHVLLTIAEYQKLGGGQSTIIDMLALPGAEDVEFEPPRAEGIFRPAEFS